MLIIKFWLWLESNQGPLVSEATALPIEPQPLAVDPAPLASILFILVSKLPNRLRFFSELISLPLFDSRLHFYRKFVYDIGFGVLAQVLMLRFRSPPNSETSELPRSFSVKEKYQNRDETFLLIRSRVATFFDVVLTSFWGLGIGMNDVRGRSRTAQMILIKRKNDAREIPVGIG